MTSCIRLSERDLEPTPPGVPGKLDDAISGAGLAAPQIGVQLRVVMFGVHANPRFVREVSGFHARVVQHECDRLHGVLYPIRIRDFINRGDYIVRLMASHRWH